MDPWIQISRELRRVRDTEGVRKGRTGTEEGTDAKRGTRKMEGKRRKGRNRETRRNKESEGGRDGWMDGLTEGRRA